MQSFEAVYARMLFAAGVRTQTELADILGIRQASISDAKKRKSIPSQWCMRLYDARGVRVDWQRHGVGPVYDEAKLAELERFHSIKWDWQDTLPQVDALHEPDRLPLLTGKEGERPVYGTLMTAEGEFPEVGRQMFPQEFLRSEAQIFRLQDAKMAPVLNRGALVAVERGVQEAGGIAAVLLGRELVFRRVAAAEGGYELRSEAGCVHFVPEAEWPYCCYGKALWAFQPLI